jgi:hypothetical protein
VNRPHPSPSATPLRSTPLADSPAERLTEVTARMGETRIRLSDLSGIQALVVADMSRRGVTINDLRHGLGDISRRAIQRLLRQAAKQPRDVRDGFLPELIEPEQGPPGR